MKGATEAADQALSGRKISIHAPVKGATRGRCGSLWRFAYFNPRSREGSDIPCLRYTLDRYHFNPRSREGSDLRPALQNAYLEYFNPRSREGSDSVPAPEQTNRDRISIHAPAKGATLSLPPDRSGRPFQSTLPRRERLGNFPTIQPHNQVFQSTLPRRERLSRPYHSNHGYYFNPRSREGSDAKAGNAMYKTLQISIHAPAKGATVQLHSQQDTPEFQSTLPRRERQRKRSCS